MTTRGARRAVASLAAAAAASTKGRTDNGEADELRFTDERQFHKWLDAVSGDWRRRRAASTATTLARRCDADEADAEYCCALSRRCPSTMRVVRHASTTTTTTVRFSGEHNHRSVVNGYATTSGAVNADTKAEAMVVPATYSGSVGERRAYMAGFEAGITNERAAADARLWCLSAEVEKLRLRLADAEHQSLNGGGDFCEEQKPFTVAAAAPPPPKKRKFVDTSDVPKPNHHCGPAPPPPPTNEGAASCCSSAASSIAVIAQAPPLPYPMDNAEAASRKLSKWYQLPAAVRERKKSVQRERYRRLMATADGCRRLQERARQRYWRNKHGYGDGSGGDASSSIAVPSMVVAAAAPPPSLNDVTIKMEAADEIVDVVDVADSPPSPPSLLSKQEQQQQQEDNNCINNNTDEKPQQLQQFLHALQQQNANTNTNNDSLNILAWAAAASTMQSAQLQPTTALGAESVAQLNNNTVSWHLFNNYSPLLAAAAAAAAAAASASSQLPVMRVNKTDYAETFRSSASGSSSSNAEKVATIAEAEPRNGGDAATTHSNNNNSKWYLLPDEVRERQKQRQRERYRRIMASESGCAILRERARRKYWRNKEKLRQRQQLDDEAQRRDIEHWICATATANAGNRAD